MSVKRVVLSSIDSFYVGQSEKLKLTVKDSMGKPSSALLFSRHLSELVAFLPNVGKVPTVSNVTGPVMYAFVVCFLFKHV